MNVLTNILVQSGLNALDPKPVQVNREDYFLSSLVCKNLADLCETGIEILDHISNSNSKNLPDKNLIQLANQTLKTFYSNDMFGVAEDGYNTIPVWKVIEGFNKEYLNNGYKIFRAIKNNVANNPASKQMNESIKERNKKYFIANFDIIFKDVPFTDTILQFKNFLSSNLLSNDQEESLWEFFDVLMHFLTNEKVILEKARQEK